MPWRPSPARPEARRAGEWAALLGLLAVITLPGCPGTVPPIPDETYLTLRAAGDLEGALARARAQLDSLEAARAPGWRVLTARAARDAAERLLAVPDSARAGLREAESLRADRVTPWDEWRGSIAGLERQLAFRRRWLGSRHPDVATTLSALARLEWAQGAAARARDLDREALAIRQAAFGSDHPAVAESHDQLGRDLKSTALDYDRALEQYETATRIMRGLGLRQTPEYATMLLDRANLYRNGNRRSESLRDFGQVLALRRRLGGPDGAGVAEALSDRGVTFAAFARNREAVRDTRDALAILDRRHEGPSSLLAITLNVYGMSLVRTGHVREALPVLRRTAQVQELRRARARDDLGRSQMFTLVAHFDCALAMLQLGDSLGAFEELERGMSRGVLEHAMARGEVTARDPWRDLFARVQRALPENTAIVGWLDSAPSGSVRTPFWCYVIRRGEPIRWITVKGTPLRDPDPSSSRMWTLQNELRAAASWPLAPRLSADLDSMQSRTWRFRVAPMERWLSGVKELVVVGTNVDFGVPLEQLRGADHRSLAEHYAITYTPSALLWVLDREHRPRADPAHWTVLLIGHPAHAGDNASAPPSSDEELDQLRAHWPAAKVLRGPEASEARLRALRDDGALERFGLVHFAVHSSNDEAFADDAGLLLADAPANLASTGGSRDSLDGRLTPFEVSQWHLGADLVVLAACRTAGPYPTRSEGYPGMGECLLQAGARNVLVNLWTVDDHATHLLVARFARELLADPRHGCGMAEALRRARLYLRDWRDAQGRQPYQHPVYWASTVLLGTGD